MLSLSLHLKPWSFLLPPRLLIRCHRRRYSCGSEGRYIHIRSFNLSTSCLLLFRLFSALSHHLDGRSLFSVFYFTFGYKGHLLWQKQLSSEEPKCQSRQTEAVYHYTRSFCSIHVGTVLITADKSSCAVLFLPGFLTWLGSLCPH